MPKVDKSTMDEHREHATVVFDESLQGKTVDAIDKRVGLDFKDQGQVSIPPGAKNMMCSGQKVPSERYKKKYSEMAWMCDDCGKMHPKGVDCEVV